MALDLTNTNKLDESFSNLVDYVPTLLPQGDRLEDSFGGSARYPAFDRMNNFRNPVEPILKQVGNALYESTPYGYYISDEQFSSIVAKDLQNFANSEEYSNMIDEEYSNGIGSWIKGVVKSVQKTTNDAIKSVKDAVKDVQKNGLGTALGNLGKEVSKLAQDAGKNIVGTIQSAGKSIKDAYESAKKWVGDNLGGGVAVHYLMRVNPAAIVMRGSIIGLLELNAVGIASAMKIVKDKSSKRFEEILQKWWMWGGDKTRYSEAVETGQRKPKLFLDIVQKFTGKKGFDGNMYYEFEGFSCTQDEFERFSCADGGGINPANAVLMASTGLGVLAKALALVPEPSGATKAAATWAGVGGAGFGALGGILKAFAKEQGASDSEANAIPEGKDFSVPPVPEDEKTLELLRQQIELAKAGKEPSLIDQPVNIDEKGNVASGGIVIDNKGKVEDLTKKIAPPSDKFLGMPRKVGITVTIVGGLALIIGGILLVKKLKK
jgi:hypothetical protein